MLLNGLFNKYRKDISVIILLTVIVSWLQIILLEPHLSYGFTPDDWWPLARYKWGGLLLTWKEQGVYSTYQSIYMNLIHNFLGFNFMAYQALNHLLKALSALTIFPLILVLFKNRFLAFVTTVLYAMAYSPIGTLELVARGSDFIAIIFMCIFLIGYYYQVKGIITGWKWSVVLMFTLILSIFLSPIRTYPILILILLAELYFCIAKRNKQNVLNSIKRLIYFFMPFVVILVLFPSSILGFYGNAPAIVSKIADGNWQLLLYPLGSLGSLFLLNDYWKLFGVIQGENFIQYLVYLVFGPTIIYFFITLFYSIILSIPSKRFLGFFMRVLTINFFLETAVYILFKHRESIDNNIRMGYDVVEIYPVFLGIYILVLSFFVFKEWIKRGKQDNALFAFWVGPIFSFVFIFCIWIFKDWSVLFKGVHTYLNIPSIGSSLFIGSTVILLYEKIKRNLGKYASVFFVLLTLITVFNINKNIIMNTWQLNNYSMNADEHELMRNRIWDSLSNYDNKKPALFYFDTTEDYINGRFYEQSILGRFSDWMFFKGKYESGSCAIPVFIINNPNLLKSIVVVDKGEIKLSYHNYCYKAYLYDIENFSAFKLVNKQPINIKNDVIKELKITPVNHE